MCGIAGAIGPRASRSQVVRMLQQMRHRGEPAYFGEIGTGGGAVIGCNRLAITDELHGAQPKRITAGRWIGVMNGEIYNHREIRQAIGGAQTESDTEALLLCMEAWGAVGIGRLEGMFACCLVDDRGAYLLARDRLGVKPLYYGLFDETIYFASELKALAGVPGIDLISELPAGHVLQDGALISYYQPPMPVRRKGEVTTEEGDSLREALTSAVSACLPGGSAPVAVLLSGGVDSATIAMLTRRLHAGRVVAYTLGTGECRSEDVDAAAVVCRSFDIEHVLVSPSVADMTRLYVNAGVWMTESFEPALIRNAVSYFFLSERVRKDGFKFCLSGEGADEIFGGYDYMRLVEDPDLAISASLHNIQRTYLQMADRASMFATLEVRVPYMERCVVEAAMALPSAGRVGSAHSKAGLRALYHGILPETIRLRSKLGMNAGGGYGSNNPGDSIYHHAVLRHYAVHPDLLDRDREVARTFPVRPSIDFDDAEQVFNMARFYEYGFAKLANAAQRRQLNTAALL